MHEKRNFLFDKCGVLHYKYIFMNSQINQRKHRQFTWPKNILMFTQKAPLQVLRTC